MFLYFSFFFFIFFGKIGQDLLDSSSGFIQVFKNADKFGVSKLQNDYNLAIAKSLERSYFL